MMDEFMPSEIARLVLGYLKETGCTEASKLFLSESPYLEECRQLHSKGRDYRTTIGRSSLHSILQEYCRSTFSSANANDRGDQSACNSSLGSIEPLFKTPDKTNYSSSSRHTVNQKIRTKSFVASHRNDVMGSPVAIRSRNAAVSLCISPRQGLSVRPIELNFQSTSSQATAGCEELNRTLVPSVSRREACATQSLQRPNLVTALKNCASNSECDKSYTISPSEKTNRTTSTSLRNYCGQSNEIEPLLNSANNTNRIISEEKFTQTECTSLSSLTLTPAKHTNPSLTGTPVRLFNSSLNTTPVKSSQSSLTGTPEKDANSRLAVTPVRLFNSSSTSTPTKIRPSSLTDTPVKSSHPSLVSTPIKLCHSSDPPVISIEDNSNQSESILPSSPLPRTQSFPSTAPSSPCNNTFDDCSSSKTQKKGASTVSEPSEVVDSGIASSSFSVEQDDATQSSLCGVTSIHTASTCTLVTVKPSSKIIYTSSCSEISSTFVNKNDTLEFSATPEYVNDPPMYTRAPATNSPRIILSHDRSIQPSFTTPSKDWRMGDEEIRSPRRKSLIPRRRLLSEISPLTKQNPVPASPSNSSTHNEDSVDHWAILEELVNFPPLAEKLAENINKVKNTEKNRDDSSKQKVLEDVPECPAPQDVLVPDEMIRDVLIRTESDPMFENIINYLSGRYDSSRDGSEASVAHELLLSPSHQMQSCVREAIDENRTQHSDERNFSVLSTAIVETDNSFKNSDSILPEKIENRLIDVEKNITSPSFERASVIDRTQIISKNIVKEFPNKNSTVNVIVDSVNSIQNKKLHSSEKGSTRVSICASLSNEEEILADNTSNSSTIAKSQNEQQTLVVQETKMLSSSVAQTNYDKSVDNTIEIKEVDLTHDSGTECINTNIPTKNLESDKNTICNAVNKNNIHPNPMLSGSVENNSPNRYPVVDSSNKGPSRSIDLSEVVRRIYAESPKHEPPHLSQQRMEFTTTAEASMSPTVYFLPTNSVDMPYVQSNSSAYLILHTAQSLPQGVNISSDNLQPSSGELQTGTASENNMISGQSSLGSVIGAPLVQSNNSNLWPATVPNSNSNSRALSYDSKSSSPVKHNVFITTTSPQKSENIRYVTLSPGQLCGLSNFALPPLHPTYNLQKILPKVPGQVIEKRAVPEKKRKRPPTSAGPAGAKRGRPNKVGDSKKPNLFSISFLHREVDNPPKDTKKKAKSKKAKKATPPEKLKPQILPSPILTSPESDHRSAMDILSDIAMDRRNMELQSPQLKSLISSARKLVGSKGRTTRNHIRVLDFDEKVVCKPKKSKKKKKKSSSSKMDSHQSKELIRNSKNVQVTKSEVNPVCDEASSEVVAGPSNNIVSSMLSPSVQTISNEKNQHAQKLTVTPLKISLPPRKRKVMPLTFSEDETDTPIKRNVVVMPCDTEKNMDIQKEDCLSSQELPLSHLLEKKFFNKGSSSNPEPPVKRKHVEMLCDTEKNIDLCSDDSSSSSELPLSQLLKKYALNKTSSPSLEPPVKSIVAVMPCDTEKNIDSHKEGTLSSPKLPLSPLEKNSFNKSSSPNVEPPIASNVAVIPRDTEKNMDSLKEDILSSPKLPLSTLLEKNVSNKSPSPSVEPPIASNVAVMPSDTKKSMDSHKKDILSSPKLPSHLFEKNVNKSSGSSLECHVKSVMPCDTENTVDSDKEDILSSPELQFSHLFKKNSCNKTSSPCLEPPRKSNIVVMPCDTEKKKDSHQENILVSPELSLPHLLEKNVNKSSSLENVVSLPVNIRIMKSTDKESNSPKNIESRDGNRHGHKEILKTPNSDERNYLESKQIPGTIHNSDHIAETIENVVYPNETDNAADKHIEIISISSSNSSPSSSSPSSTKNVSKVAKSKKKISKKKTNNANEKPTLPSGIKLPSKWRKETSALNMYSSALSNIISNSKHKNDNQQNKASKKTKSSSPKRKRKGKKSHKKIDNDKTEPKTNSSSNVSLCNELHPKEHSELLKTETQHSPSNYPLPCNESSNNIENSSLTSRCPEVVAEQRVDDESPSKKINAQLPKQTSNSKPYASVPSDSHPKYSDKEENSYSELEAAIAYLHREHPSNEAAFDNAGMSQEVACEVVVDQSTPVLSKISPAALLYNVPVADKRKTHADKEKVQEKKTASNPPTKEKTASKPSTKAKKTASKSSAKDKKTNKSTLDSGELLQMMEATDNLLDNFLDVLDYEDEDEEEEETK